MKVTRWCSTLVVVEGRKQESGGGEVREKDVQEERAERKLHLAM